MLPQAKTVSASLAHDNQQLRAQVERLIASLKEAEHACDAQKIAVSQLAISNSDLSAQLDAAKQVVEVARCSALSDPRGRLAQAIEAYDLASGNPEPRAIPVDVRGPILTAAE